MEYYKDGVHVNEDGTKEYDINFFLKKSSFEVYLEKRIIEKYKKKP